MFLYIELVTEFETLLSFPPPHVLTPAGFRGLRCLHRCFQMQLMCCTSRGEMFCHVSPLVLRIWPSSLGLSPEVSSCSFFSQLYHRMLMLTYTGRVNLEEMQQQRESEKSGQVTLNRRSSRSLVNGRQVLSKLRLCQWKTR